MSQRHTSLDEDTKSLVLAAQAPLEDDLWWAIVVDAVRIPDLSISTLSLSVGVEVSRAALGEARSSNELAARLRCCEELLRSRRVSAMLLGARAAKHIAEMNQMIPELFGLFERMPARQRCLMLRHSCPRDTETLEDFIRRGLTDGAASVREWAADAAAYRKLRSLTGLVAAAVAREPNADTAAWIRQCVSHLEQGYWLSPTDSLGLRSCEFVDLGGTAIPAEIVEALGEAEVVERVRRILSIPPSKPDSEWLDGVISNWRTARGLD